MSEDTGTPIREDYPLLWELGEDEQFAGGDIMFESNAINLEARKALTEIWRARLEGVVTDDLQEIRACLNDELLARFDAFLARVATLEADLERELAMSARIASDRAKERIELERRNAELTKALERIKAWDCLNPPATWICGDFPWLLSEINKALADGAEQ